MRREALIWKLTAMSMKKGWGIQQIIPTLSGYGDIPLSFNREIARVLDVGKTLGVTLTPDHLMIPQKSMLGLIGIGTPERKKQCGQCVMKEDCAFRKRGQRCY